MRTMAVCCHRFGLSPAEFWELDTEETAALFDLLEEMTADG